MSTEEIVRLMNEEDAAVITAVNRCIPEIAAIADVYAETLKNGGRVSISVPVPAAGLHCWMRRKYRLPSACLLIV